MKLVTSKKQRKEATFEKHLLHINSAPIGEEPREEYYASIVSWAVTEKSIAMQAERRKSGGS